MDVVEFGPLAPEQRAELEGDELDPFDTRGITLHYRRKAMHVALQSDDGRLVASTGLLIVDVEVGAASFAAVGIGGVFVNQSYRGRGLAREVFGAALTKARTLGPRFVLLFCHADRAGLYRKLGFVRLDAEVLVEQPEGPAVMPQWTMWRALHDDGAAWPDGPVRVMSLPF